MWEEILVMAEIIVDDLLDNLQNYDLSSIQDDVVRFNLETLAKCKQYTSKFRINLDGTHTCL